MSAVSSEELCAIRAMEDFLYLDYISDYSNISDTIHPAQFSAMFFILYHQFCVSFKVNITIEYAYLVLRIA